MRQQSQPQRMPPLRWDTKPPDGPQDEQWDILRPKGSKQITAIVLSHQLLGRHTHWWGGRTKPCWDTDTCPACIAGVARTWRGYLAATDEKLRERWILELTRNVAIYVDKDFHKLRTLKGSGIWLKRKNGKDTGPIACGPWSPGVPNQQLPDCPDLIQKLCCIWQVHWVPIEAQQQLPQIRLAPTGTEAHEPPLD